MIRQLLAAFFRSLRFVVNLYLLYLFKRRLPNLKCSYVQLYKNTVEDWGIGNTVLIEEGSSLQNCNLTFHGSNCILHLGRNVNINECDFWFEDDGGGIFIGENTTIESGCFFSSCEGRRIIIGNDCMLSHGIDIRNTDSHSLLNEKGERINPSADICLGDHVWVGIRSTILKGVMIPSGCVVAAESMVTSSIKAHEHSLLAGMPARVIKTDVFWDRKRI